MRAAAAALAALALVALALAAPPAPAAALALAAPPPPAPAAPSAPTAAERAAAERVLRFWTPERMRRARPLEMAVDRRGRARVFLGTRERATAGASFLRVPSPDAFPYSVNGRVFIRQGGELGFCSGTAINSPTRQLVLTAGHCVHSGPKSGRRGVWSNFLQFVPAYSGGAAPFGAFVARRETLRAPRQWVKGGNPTFDLGAFLTRPNAEGVNVADAVGGGAAIALGLSRKQQFRTFGYPGQTKWMQGCNSPYIGDDPLTYRLAGPPTLGIGCRWAPGASGGAWLIGDGTPEGTWINGVNSYLHVNNKSRTYGPYFNPETVGKLVRGY